MKNLLMELSEKSLKDIEEASDIKSIETLKISILGKKGKLTSILKEMGSLSKEERPIIGEMANNIRNNIEEKIQEKIDYFSKIIKEQRIKDEKIDVTIKSNNVRYGHRHPLIQTKEELENLFLKMGFMVIDGPEIETVENNFDLLNSPLNHPSRDMSDTFYINDELVLRTHTSPVQIRTMKKYGAPLRMVSAGRTFRFDDVDDTHSPMFHQIEGLVIGENITMANLKHTLDEFIKQLFGDRMQTRYRPHHFPFTEPSAEVDVTCTNCFGDGCDSCHQTGWSMELLGCGMVHPNVLENCGIDSEKYTGFAFGMGLDRITLVKYGINNIRLLFENDNRFSEQF